MTKTILLLLKYNLNQYNNTIKNEIREREKKPEIQIDM